LNYESRIIRGGISGKTIHLPDVNTSSNSSIKPGRFILVGKPVTDFALGTFRHFPDAKSFKRKFGLLIPATNTSMEFELWSIIFKNSLVLEGIGIHTTNIITPKFKISTEEDLEAYKIQFIDGLQNAITNSTLAQPEYLIMGMSLEHIIYGLSEIRNVMDKVEKQFPYAWATWHDAADAGLKKYKAKRIGLISPFNEKGNSNAKKMFEDMGYEVVATFGFDCTNLNDIAHIPDSAKEEAILKYLATSDNKLDAVVQLGTNMSMINVAEEVEPKIGIPILGINAVTFWYALRENGFNDPVIKSGRLLREF
jgi:maleate isomerase